MQESLTPRSLDWLRCVLPIALFDSAVTQSHRVVRLCYSAVSFPLRNLTPWCPSHCGIWLLGVLPTAESDSPVSFPLRNLSLMSPESASAGSFTLRNLTTPQRQTLQCPVYRRVWLPAHHRVWLCSFLPTTRTPRVGNVQDMAPNAKLFHAVYQDEHDNVWIVSFIKQMLNYNFLSP